MFILVTETIVNFCTYKQFVVFVVLRYFELKFVRLIRTLSHFDSDFEIFVCDVQHGIQDIPSEPR